MAFFGNTFRKKIKTELERRRNFDGVQDVLVPHVRVTSMVQTPASGISVNGFSLPAIKGFTLGPHDLVSNTTLDSLSNINNTGCVIGTTYIDGSPKQVVVPTHKNLPSPGVTNVSIETKGGLMFKATINLKFYGKEQYDAIYQLFMKPGRPIAIEFGHTNTNKKDLDFFTNFDEAITRFSDDLRKFKPSIPDNPNSGVAVGLVSNFKISLNENNEYEATIDLVNGLEFMFTLPVEETSLDFKQRGLSKSIKENFGMTTGLEYTPKFDCVYKTILDDLQTNSQYAREILWPDNKDVDQFAGGRPELQFRGESTGFLKNVNLQRQMNFVYVGMDYLITVLIPKILQSTNGGLIRNLNDNTIDRRQENNVKLPIIDFGPVGRWNTLRSNNISNVIFNNVNLYDPRINSELTSTKFGSRIEDYQERFETLGESEFDVLLSSLFFSTPEWSPDHKNTYPSVIPADGDILQNYKRLNNTTNSDGNDLPNYLSGIFVSYGLVKSSLTSSNSLSEAIIKILNSINAASTDILKLKLQIVRDVNKETNEETERLIIYDEREAFRQEDLLGTEDHRADSRQPFATWSCEQPSPGHRQPWGGH